MPVSHANQEEICGSLGFRSENRRNSRFHCAKGVAVALRSPGFNGTLLLDHEHLQMENLQFKGSSTSDTKYMKYMSKKEYLEKTAREWFRKAFYCY